MAGCQDKNPIVGTWKIIECVSLSGSEATGIEGTEFELTDNGDVHWNVMEGCQKLPLFWCQMYEVRCYGTRTLLRFAAFNGHIIEFRLDQPVMSRDLMLLTYDGWFMLQCEKVNNIEPTPDLPYSLLNALQDQYFTDMTLQDNNGCKYEVHSTIVVSSLPELDWTLNPLSHLTSDELSAVVHFIYTRSLPPNLHMPVAKKVLQATTNLSGLHQFRQLCRSYIRNTILRNKIYNLIKCVHECLDQMIELFDPTRGSSMSTPSHLVNILKTSLRHMAVGVVKVVEVCQQFERSRDWLGQKEQQDTIRYIRSRLPILLGQVARLFNNVHLVLAALTHHTRTQLAQQLVPEIRDVFETVCNDVTTLRSSLEHIILSSSTLLDSSHSPLLLLAKLLNNDLHLRELQKLRILQENLSSLVNSILQKRYQFEEFGGVARVRGVARILETFTEELPILILRLEEFTSAINEVLEWPQFKFIFKGATSKIGSIVERLSEHSSLIEGLMQDLRDRVGHPSFTSSLFNLGLLQQNSKDSKTEKVAKSFSEENQNSMKGAVNKDKSFARKTSNVENNESKVNTADKYCHALHKESCPLTSNSCLKSSASASKKGECVCLSTSIESCSAYTCSKSISECNQSKTENLLSSKSSSQEKQTEKNSDEPINFSQRPKDLCTSLENTFSELNLSSNERAAKNISELSKCEELKNCKMPFGVSEKKSLNLPINPNHSEDVAASNIEAEGIASSSTKIKKRKSEDKFDSDCSDENDIPADVNEELNLVQNICLPPPSQHNHLATFMSKLLQTGQMTDMIFLIVPPPDDECSSTSSSPDDSCTSLANYDDDDDNVCVKKSLSLDQSNHFNGFESISDSSNKSFPVTCESKTSTSSTAAEGVGSPNGTSCEGSQAAALGNKTCNTSPTENSGFSNNSSVKKSSDSYQSEMSKFFTNDDSAEQPLGLSNSFPLDEIQNEIDQSAEASFNDTILIKSSDLSKFNHLIHMSEDGLPMLSRPERSKEQNLNDTLVITAEEKIRKILNRKGYALFSSTIRQNLRKQEIARCNRLTKSKSMGDESASNYSLDADGTSFETCGNPGKKENASKITSPQGQKFVFGEKRKKEESNKKTQRKPSGEENSNVDAGPDMSTAIEIPAHRVVVAARCEWFKRALLSGMREAIDRKIIVHGCDVETFSLLLQFLYAGHVECNALPTDQLVDLLVLVDHYGVDNLKTIVESSLEQHVDDESVIPLLTVAHHCNASQLKEVCLQHCALQRINLESEAVLQLPNDLQNQLVSSLNTLRKWGVCGHDDEMMIGGEHNGRGMRNSGWDSPSSIDPLVDDDSSTLLLPGLHDDRTSGRSSSRSSLDDPAHW